MSNKNNGLIFNKNKLFFTSDLHFYHNNIIKYVDRPFKSLKHMHETMILNWNKKVPQDGIVFILGDFIFTGNIDKTREILSRLNGLKCLVLGNHDEINKLERDSIKELFHIVDKQLFITVNDKEIGDKQHMFLNHYPMVTWRDSAKGSWQLHGHLHTSPKVTLKDKGLFLNPTQYDVGVDNNKFTPVSYEDIKIIITKQCLKKK